MYRDVEESEQGLLLLGGEALLLGHAECIQFRLHVVGVALAALLAAEFADLHLERLDGLGLRCDQRCEGLDVGLLGLCARKERAAAEELERHD